MNNRQGVCVCVYVCVCVCVIYAYICICNEYMTVGTVENLGCFGAWLLRYV